MKKAKAECYRALKPGRWLSLCYHDTSEGTWALIQDIPRGSTEQAKPERKSRMKPAGDDTEEQR